METQLFNPVHIANFFVRKGVESDNPTTILPLIKMVYISHGCNLAFYNEPLFKEPVEAWKYGPVVPSVYYAFRHNGSEKITKEE